MKLAVGEYPGRIVPARMVTGVYHEFQIGQATWLTRRSICFRWPDKARHKIAAVSWIRLANRLAQGSDNSPLRARSGSGECDAYEEKEKWPDGARVREWRRL